MSRKKFFSLQIRRFIVAGVAIVIAASLRVWPLHGLGTLLVWLTFYPAVMVASLYGGLYAGLLGTGLAVLIALFGGPLLVGAPFITKTADWIGVGVFVFTGSMISGVAEAMLRANARARKAQELAEAANKAKSVFLASMSHELRTPLNAILGFSGLLRTEVGLSQEQRQALDLINRAGEHLLHLIDDVLDVAKIEAGRLTVQIAPFDLIELTRDVTDLIRVRAVEKGLQLSLEQTAAVPRQGRGDGAKLRQALINLLGNAVKFTPQGGVTLRIDVRPAETPQAVWLMFEVADTGIGIAAEDQERIFEPFYQVLGGSRQSLHKGTGLGLSITRQFIELMGGHIRVKSLVGRGSCFRFELPVELAAEAEISTRPINRARVIGVAPGQPEYRILIVEDQVENWLLLQRLLTDAGLTVRVAENGQLGIEAFEAWHPHFIWMDIRIPVVDGLEATRRIRAMAGGDTVKIAALTASVFKEERDRVMAAGMDDFVRKPFQPGEIFDCLTRNLGIEFVREEVTVATEVIGVSLDAEALASLPAALHHDLYDALVGLDIARLGEQVCRVTELNPALGEALARHVEQLALTPILHALKAGGTNPTERVEDRAMNPGDVLIVDDNPASLKLLEGLLSAEGYRVRPADSGELALASGEVWPPELILLDIRMPEMDGYEVLRRLKAREQSRAIPVMFLSAVIESEQRVEGFRQGAVDFISKPFQREELLARVGTHLELFRLRARLEHSVEDLQQTNEQLRIAELAERKQATENLARSHAELQRFAEISAHHLQEPARRIATYAERLTAQLAGRLDDAEARLSLEYIDGQARREQNLLRDVERYLAAGQPRGKIKSLDTGKVVAKLLEGMADRIRAAAAEVTLGDLPATRMDVARLMDVFAAVLDNALQFGRKEARLRIGIQGERFGTQVRFSVSDNGPGIEPAYRERAFRVFERLTTAGEGTGIGLAILRRVAESSGGRAWIGETPGGGCCVMFELPAGEVS
ncbi:MAG: response regulator [Methylococcaceae bacterium]|nr:response regulator [Methylococcaceae bacterium]